MKKLRAAVAGIGNISRTHLKAIESCENAVLTAVCDIIKSRADAAADEYGAKAFYDFDQMLSDGDFDVLHICTPHYLHAQMAIKAMNGHKHVLTEKPMAMLYDDAVKMAEIAEKQGVYLGVCFQNRYNRSSVALKQLIDSHALGMVTGIKGSVTWDRGADYYAQDAWRGTLDYEGGGVLINQAIHTLDLVQWLCPGNYESVEASISQKRLKGIVQTEDTADALITFDSGIKALFYASICYSANSPVSIEVECENGRLLFNGDIFVMKNGAPTEIISFDQKQGDKAYWGDSHTLLINDFYSSVAAGRAFALNGREGLAALKIISDIYKQCR